MSKDERKLKAKVDEYFEKHWSVSFEKFIENWEETSEALKYKDKEIERLNNIINGMEKFFQYAYDNEVRPLNDRKVSVWTICLDKLQELKGSGKECI